MCNAITVELAVYIATCIFNEGASVTNPSCNANADRSECTCILNEDCILQMEMHALNNTREEKVC